MKPSLSCKPNQRVERSGTPLFLVIFLFLGLLFVGPARQNRPSHSTTVAAKCARPRLAVFWRQGGGFPGLARFTVRRSHLQSGSSRTRSFSAIAETPAHQSNRLISPTR